LLTKFGLAQFTAGLFWGLADDWCLAFDIFDALSPHAVAVSYTRPIHTTRHNALSLNSMSARVHSKAVGNHQTGGFASAPQTMPHIR
jgi:hypothetical protein